MKQLCVTVNFYVVLFLIVNSHLLCFMLCVGQNFDEEYCQPKSIKRRYSGDIVVDTGVGHITCNEDNRTYMVEENRCVKNENLYSGKSALTHNNITIAIPCIETSRMQIFCSNSKAGANGSKAFTIF